MTTWTISGSASCRSRRASTSAPSTDRLAGRLRRPAWRRTIASAGTTPTGRTPTLPANHDRPHLPDQWRQRQHAHQSADPGQRLDGARTTRSRPPSRAASWSGSLCHGALRPHDWSGASRRANTGDVDVTDISRPTDAKFPTLLRAGFQQRTTTGGQQRQRQVNASTRRSDGRTRAAREQAITHADQLRATLDAAITASSSAAETPTPRRRECGDGACCRRSGAAFGAATWMPTTCRWTMTRRCPRRS